MARSRIVLETSDQRKTALVKAAALQGATLTDWFEEQVADVIPRLAEDIAEPYIPEVHDPDELLNSKKVFETISAQDWAFKDEDTRYLTHDLHPYPAKFIPQIPAHLIARLSVRGDVVCDPFGGSATTAVEAVRLGRRAVSFDANPLAALIGRVKTGFMSSSVRADLEQLSVAIEGHLISPEAKRRSWTERLKERYQKYVPSIPHADKWFCNCTVGELALIRHLIGETTQGLARDAAQLALSRIIIRVSNQESETRYVSVEKSNDATLTLRAYLQSLRAISRRLETAALDLQFADARFLVGDSRVDLTHAIGENTVDLIVTSPPYPNATDYHLYHRFRLFWLGFDPRALGEIEIGSHLRHQRNDTGFEEYREDMTKVLQGCAKILSPGRFAVFVLGDAIFKGETFSTSDAVCETARTAGLTLLGVINRPIHQTRRSFAKPARRMISEQLVILQKPNRPVTVQLNPPAYRMWRYEEELRLREIQTLVGSPVDVPSGSKSIALALAQPAIWRIRRLTFTRDFLIEGNGGAPQPTWQKVLENGDADPAKRKDPKYVTHGLHPFKGKFYPQLAKSLLTISGVRVGARLLDPYCGSGTTVLEGMLNGFAAYGCDMNPLAAKIARAKTGILSVPRDVADLSLRALMDRLSHRQGSLPLELEQFPDNTHEELLSWFPTPVLHKLNWLLSQVRLLGNPILVDFFEVIISSLIREVSNQDPLDLRIRRRKKPLQDAPVFEMFRNRLEEQHSRLQKYWSVAGRQPGKLVPPTVVQGDSRYPKTMELLGLSEASVDCVVTSPPYATALPYIDTDRLSLLAIMGLQSDIRSNLEENLTGSREIRRHARKEAEGALLANSATEQLPISVVRAIRTIYRANKNGDVGFRRANMGALLWRYFTDMRRSFLQVSRVLKPGAKAFYVIGDSRTNAGGDWISIETSKHIAEIGAQARLKHIESIDIDVTTENYKHIRNAIKENQVIVFQKLD